jgi:hypothetical protein
MENANEANLAQIDGKLIIPPDNGLNPDPFQNEEA